MAVSLAESYLTDYAARMPDQTDLVDAFVLPQDQISQLNRLFSFFKIMRWVWRATPVLTIGFLLLIIITASVSLRSTLNWTGFQLLQIGFGSGFNAFLIFLAGFLFSKSFPGAGDISAIAALFESIIFSLRDVIYRTALWTAAISAVVFLMGVLMVIVAQLNARKS